MSVGCTCARRTVPNEDAGGRSSPPGAPSSLPPSPHHLPIPSLHVLAALSTFSPPCSPLLLPSRTLTRTINHPREVPFSSPISYLLALERRHGRESSLVTVDVANVIQHSKQRGCCACERARARVCFFFFSFLFFFWWGVEETEEEVGERGDMKRVCLCLLRDPLSVTDHRLSFTCTNDLAIATEILLTRFPWRSSLSFYPWGLNLVPIGVKIFRDNR